MRILKYKRIDININWYSSKKWIIIPTIGIDFNYKFLTIEFLKLEIEIDLL